MSAPRRARASLPLAIAVVISGLAFGCAPRAASHSRPPPAEPTAAPGSHLLARARLEARLEVVQARLMESAPQPPASTEESPAQEDLARERLELVVALSLLDRMSADPASVERWLGHEPTVGGGVEGSLVAAARAAIADARTRPGRGHGAVADDRAPELEEEDAFGDEVLGWGGRRDAKPKEGTRGGGGRPGGSSPVTALPPPPPPALEAPVDEPRKPAGRESAVVAEGEAPLGVMDAVQARMAELQGCLSAGGVDIGGARVDVRARVAADGHLRQAQVSAPTLPAVARECLEAVLRDVRIQNPSAGSRVVSFSLWVGS